MTIPAEELQALIHAREFIRELGMGRAQKVSAIRKEAFHVLRHFPGNYLLEDMWKERIAEYENMLGVDNRI